jgi:hypothetical protein
MPFLRPLFCVVSLIATASPVTAQSIASTEPNASRVFGIVIDGARDPIANAEVTFLSKGEVRLVGTTDANGRFTLGNFTPGKAMLQVRRIGYEQRNMNITVESENKPTQVEVLLDEVPQKLEEVMVKADEQGRLRDFSEHKSEKNNFGHYFDRSDIRKRNPTYASELFRTVPGVQVQASDAGGNIVRVRGCRPLLWVDGQRVPGAELDEVVRPSDIAGMEFYSSNAGIPPEFMDRDNGACGIVIVWSKSR